MAKAKEIARFAELLRKAKHAVALARGNHDKLVGQRWEETKKLREIAQAVHELQAAKVDSTDVSTLIPFFSDMVGKLGALDVWISKFCDGEIASCAREIAETILPRGALPPPRFPLRDAAGCVVGQRGRPVPHQGGKSFHR